MSSSRHLKAKQIFLAACDLDLAARGPFLARECDDDAELRTEVEAMLAFDEEGPSLLPEQGVRIPLRIAQYDIKGILGRGGMGIVYRATQEQPRRDVALKVVVPELATEKMLRRFANEVQYLGGLRHDGIAQVYEAGTTDTERGIQPWFAMELVEGEPIHEWVQAREANAFATLELVAKVADAVQYAHECGIVHRDLKPDNVLVKDSGQPKILDFGIARAIDPEMRTTTIVTHAGEVVGTLAYMSPEQARGATEEIDARSDVWALGVIAYELLSGRLPVDVRGKPVAEAARLVRDVEAKPLGRVARELRGDIETVIGKALEKDATRRYQSASDLAGDLRRLMRREPVHARPPTARYRLVQFARRNRGLAAGLGATAIALVAGSVLSIGFAVRANEAAERERASATESRFVARFLESLFLQRSPEFMRGKPRSEKRILDTGAERIRRDLEEFPKVQTRLMRVIAKAYYGLGQFHEARALLDEAREIGTREFGERSLGVAETLFLIGSIHVARGQGNAAESFVAQALAITREIAGTENPNYAEHCTGLGVVRLMQGMHAEALELLNEGLAVRRRVLEPDDPNIAQSIDYLATLYDEMGDVEEAIELAKEAVAWWSRSLPANHPRRANGATSLGIALSHSDRHAEAVPHFEEALRIQELVLPANHPNLLFSRLNLASCLCEVGSFERARPIVARVLGSFDPAQHPPATRALALALRGYDHEHCNRLDAAAKDLDESLRILGSVSGEAVLSRTEIEERCASLHERRNEPQRAIALRVARVRRHRRGPQKALQGAVADLAALYRRLGRGEDALRLERRFAVGK